MWERARVAARYLAVHSDEENRFLMDTAVAAIIATAVATDEEFQTKAERNGTDHSPPTIERNGPGARMSRTNGKQHKLANIMSTAAILSQAADTSARTNRIQPISAIVKIGPVTLAAANSVPSYGPVIIHTATAARPARTTFSDFFHRGVIFVLWDCSCDVVLAP